MPTSTLTVTQADGSSETYTINRDEFEGIRTMNRKLDETIGDPENITGFTVSIGIASTNGTYTKSGLINGKPLFLLDSNNDFELRWTGTQWRWHDDNNGDVFYTSSEDTDYPWEVTTWVGGSQPTFSSFVGGIIGSTVTDTVSVDHTPTDDIRNLLVDAQNVTINRSRNGAIRTLFIDGVEVTIDRSDEVIVEGFVSLFPTSNAAFSTQLIGTHQAILNARRGSDGVEVDVYPDSSTNKEVSASSPIVVTSGSSTATTFGEFVASDEAFVTAWYDQSGSNNLEQPLDALQPKIASAGVVLDGITYDGSGQQLQASASASAYDISMFAVLQPSNTTQFATAGSARLLNFGLNGTDNRFYFGNSGTTLTARFGNPVQHFSSHLLTTDKILLSSFANTSEAFIFVNGSSKFSVNPTVGGTGITSQTIGVTGFTGAPFEGKVQEVILYPNSQLSNRTDIEDDINSRHTIY